MDTLWGDFESLVPDEKEVETPEVEKEELEVEEPKKKEEEKKEEPKSEEKTEEPEKKEEPKVEKKEEDGEEEDDLVKAFGSIESLLEEEELMFLDEETEYSGDSEGFAKMMRDNMEGQKKSMEAEFAKKEAAIRQEFEKANTPGYSDMDINDEAQASEMLKEYYTRTGLEEAEIEEKLAELKDLDYISKEAKVAQRYLVKEEDKASKAAAAKAEEETLARQEKVDEYISGLKSEIDSAEEMAGFKMTNKVKNGFKDYVFKVGKDGMTEAQRAGKDPSRRLRLAFLDYMDFNKNDFEIKAKTEVSTELKKKTSRFSSKGASAKGVSVEAPKDEKFDKGFLDFWAGNNDNE